MRILRPFAIAALAVAGAIALSALVSFPGHAASPAAPHKTIKAISVDPNNGIYSFSPKKLTIKIGTKITWTNPSDTDHNVTSTTKGWTFAKDLTLGGTVSHTFKKTGTFRYQCTLHPGMTAKIIVTK